MIDLKIFYVNDLSKHFIVNIDNDDYGHKKYYGSEYCLCHDIFLHDMINLY